MFKINSENDMNYSEHPLIILIGGKPLPIVPLEMRDHISILILIYT